jgi:2-oxoglutarate ferredoxin oxidoreductase subunit beta
MITAKDAAWCPGCGNFAIANVIDELIGELPVPREKIVFTSGIGQAAKLPHYLTGVNYFNGLHGRAVPPAVGIKLARPDLTVIAVSGDGCNYGEGGNHFIHTIRRNLDITILTCDNKVYGLTKGQSAPTSDLGVRNNLDPGGNLSEPLNPMTLAIAMGAPFVARSFSGDAAHLKEVIRGAILFKGTSVVDIFQPCVSFNKINTHGFYRQRVYKVEPTRDRYEAMRTADTWGDRIPIGIIYRDDERQSRREERRIFRHPVSEEAVTRLLRAEHAGK